MKYQGKTAAHVDLRIVDFESVHVVIVFVDVV